MQHTNSFVQRMFSRRSSTAIAPCEEGDNRHVVLLNLLLSIVVDKSVITAIFPEMTTGPYSKTAEPGILSVSQNFTVTPIVQQLLLYNIQSSYLPLQLPVPISHRGIIKGRTSIKGTCK